MIVPDLAIYELAAILITIPLSYVIARVAKMVQRNGYEDDVRTLFYLYWNGTDEDELYAWYKVRHILLKRERDDRKLNFVERKIAQVNKQRLYGEMSVNEKGLLVDERKADPKIH